MRFTLGCAADTARDLALLSAGPVSYDPLMKQRPRAAVRVSAVAALLLVAVTACDNPLGGSDGPVDSGVGPVPLELPAPSYALATKEGLSLRVGDVERVFPKASDAEWLPGGRALLREGDRTRIWDPATDELTDPLPFADPNRAVTQIDLIGPEYGPRDYDDPYGLTAYDLDGEERWRIDLPLTDNPEASKDNELQRSYLSAHTIDGTTFLRWHDGSEYYDDHGDYGLLLVGPDGEFGDDVLVNVPVIAVWLAADGSALLATKRVSGDPCGGCQVTQELAELDPETGEILAEHSLPEEYDANWDVREVDKVGDRIAVRFEETVFTRGKQALHQRGTWVLDDEGWSVVPGSDEEVSWWQGPDDRIVAVPIDKKGGFSGYDFTYWWEHDGERTRLPGRHEYDGGRIFYNASVPGQLLAP